MLIRKRAARAAALGSIAGLIAIGSFMYMSERGFSASSAHARDVAAPKVKA
jgi:hypothetical protein